MWFASIFYSKYYKKDLGGFLGIVVGIWGGMGSHLSRFRLSVVTKVAFVYWSSY